MGNLISPAPPHDLVVISVMRRTFYKNGERTTGKLGNVYFHCRNECIKLVQPAFLPFLVVIPSDIRARLLDVHKQYLRQELHIE
jgi:hypothetical protein